MQIVKIHNPFNRADRDISVLCYEPGETLLDVRNKVAPQDIEFVVSIDGKVVPADKLEVTYPHDGAQIILLPALQGGGSGGGKQIVAAIAMIAIAVAAPYASAAMLGYNIGAQGVIAAAMTHSALAMGLLTAGIMVVGGILVNALLPPPKPKIPTLDKLDFDSGSQTYSWSPQTVQQQGGVVPKFYGKNKLYGNIISAHLENINDQQYAHALICLGTGPYSSLSNFKVNDQPIESFQNVVYETRMGHLNQTVISNFNDTRTSYAASIKISYGSPYVYTTLGNDYDGLEVDINFPQGLWYADDQGGMQTYSVGVKIEIKKQGDIDWTVVANESVSGSHQQILRRTYKKLDLVHGVYDVRITRTTAEAGSTRYGDDMYFGGVNEVYCDDFEYPGHVLVGLKALATDQLSGSLRFSCIADCSLVRINDGSQWTVGYSNNPAWVCWDILTQPVFDNDLNVLEYNGIDPARIDLVMFKEWADFCDTLVPDGKGGTEKRITFNGGFDNESYMWDAALQVCQIGRATLVWIGMYLTLAIDKSGEPDQLFSVGNIDLDFFRESFLPMEDRATEIEIDYVNAERDYERSKVTIFADGMPNTRSKTSLQLAGCTSPSEAWRAGRYRLYNNMYITRTIEFEVDVDAIACRVGSVVNVQHDVPQWGYGGRLVLATNSTITLDKEVTIEAGKQYAVLIRLADDTVVERSIVSDVGTFSVFAVATPFETAPAVYDVYAFGEINKVAKPFRVLSISRTQDQMVSVTAIEYNESIYNCDLDLPVLPTLNYSPTVRLAPIGNVTITEEIATSKERTYSRLLVRFAKPGWAPFAFAEAWVSTDAGVTWEHYTDAVTDFYIDPAEDDKTYHIKLRATNGLNEKEDLANVSVWTYSVQGKNLPPSDVPSFTAINAGDTVNLKWGAATDIDLAQYEVRRGTTFGAGLMVCSVKGLTYTFTGVRPGVHTFWIAAKDTTGNYSTTPISSEVNVLYPPGYTDKHTWTTQFADGTHNNTAYKDDPVYGRVLYVSTGLTGDWTSPIYDMASIKDMRFWNNLDYIAIGDETIWEGKFDAADTWEKYGNVPWAVIFSQSIASGISVEFFYSTDGSNWFSKPHFELFAAEVNARYVSYKITLQNISSTNYNYIKPITLTGAYWQ